MANQVSLSNDGDGGVRCPAGLNEGNPGTLLIPGQILGAIAGYLDCLRDWVGT